MIIKVYLLLLVSLNSQLIRAACIFEGHLMEVAGFKFLLHLIRVFYSMDIFFSMSWRLPRSELLMLSGDLAKI